MTAGVEGLAAWPPAAVAAVVAAVSPVALTAIAGWPVAGGRWPAGGVAVAAGRRA